MKVTPEILDRKPPADEAAELALIGELLIDPKLWPKIAAIVGPEDFYAQPYRLLARAMFELWERRITPDHVALLAAMKSVAEPEAGSWAWIVGEACNQATGINAEYYAASIRRAAGLRRMRDDALTAIQAVYTPGTDPQTVANLLSAAGERLKEILPGKHSIGTLRESAFAYIEQMQAGAAPLIELGLPDLDYALGGGVEYGEMIIVAARPSHGKSASALQVLHHVTANGFPAAIVSQEMKLEMLAKRTLQFASPEPVEHWRTSTRELLSDVSQHFHGRSECYVIESANSADRAATLIRKVVKEHGVKVVAVDYAQLLSAPGKTDYERTTHVSRVMREVTTECGIVLLLLCQLNREIEKRPNFIPKLSDLRGSGQLEQDADVIVFVVWPWKIDSKRNPHEYQFFIEKNRNRAINTPAIQCVFAPSRQMLSVQPIEATQFDSTNWR